MRTSRIEQTSVDQTKPYRSDVSDRGNLSFWKQQAVALPGGIPWLHVHGGDDGSSGDADHVFPPAPSCRAECRGCIHRFGCLPVRQPPHRPDGVVGIAPLRRWDSCKPTNRSAGSFPMTATATPGATSKSAFRLASGNLNVWSRIGFKIWGFEQPVAPLVSKN
jgi:hypothetical protein